VAQRFSAAIRIKARAALAAEVPSIPKMGFPPRITFAAHPSCLSFAQKKTTLESVKRLYTMARVKGGMKFTCSHCAHHVSTLDFDARDGNLRTQAATAINRHATSIHHEPVMFSSLDTQQRIWRP
jgi:hypothetical protein